MKKKSGWISFFVDSIGAIVIAGSGMYPEIYQTKKEALFDTHSDCKKITPPQPVKIEWMVEE